MAVFCNLADIPPHVSAFVQELRINYRMMPRRGMIGFSSQGTESELYFLVWAHSVMTKPPPVIVARKDYADRQSHYHVT